MPQKFKPIIPGTRFTRLVAIHRIDGTRDYLCKCDCGIVTPILAARLRLGNTKSCGCLKSDLTSARTKTHGLSKTTEHNIWLGIKKRCYDNKCVGYKRYGGRGITMCERWKKSFVSFLTDMGKRPSTSHSIDRFPNNEGNYEPGNCRWATKTEQARNRSSSVLNEAVVKTFKKALVNRTVSIRAVGEKCGISLANAKNIAGGHNWKEVSSC